MTRTITLFPSADNPRPMRDVALHEIVDAIRSGAYALPIAELQRAEGETRVALKRSLPAFTAGGTFTKRNNTSCSEASGALVLDFDDVPDLTHMQMRTAANPHAIAGFVSPTGTGYKVIYAYEPPTTDNDTFRHAFDAARHHAETWYGLNIDRSGRDISRLCFVSHDPEALYTDDVQPITYSTVSTQIPVRAIARTQSGTLSYDDLLRQAQRIMSRAAEHGSRHGQVARIAYLFGGYIAGGHADEATAEAVCHEVIDEAFPNEPERRRDERRTVRDGLTAGRNKPITEIVQRNPVTGRDVTQTPFDQVSEAVCELITLRRNHVTMNIEYVASGDLSGQWATLDDRSVNNILAHVRSLGIKTSKDRLWEVLDTDAIAPDWNPYTEYFDPLRYTGSDEDARGYMSDLVDLLPLADPLDLGPEIRDYTSRVLSSWMCGCYASIARGAVNQIMPILQGAQGIGKSTFVRYLCPSPLREYVYEGSIHDETEDAKRLMAQTFIHIDDELESLTRRDLSAIKRIITQPTVSFRKPYARVHVTRPRTCSFIGSVNRETFLSDETGSRRFPIIALNAPIDLDAIKSVDLDRLWAIAKWSVESGVRYWLNSDDHKTTERINEPHKIVSMADELLCRHFVPADEGEHLTTTEVALAIAKAEAMLNSDARIAMTDQFVRQIGTALTKRGFVRSGKRRDNGVRYGYTVRRLTI